MRRVVSGPTIRVNGPGSGREPVCVESSRSKVCNVMATRRCVEPSVFESAKHCQMC